MSRIRGSFVAAAAAALFLTTLVATGEAQRPPGGGGGQPRPPAGGNPSATGQHRAVPRSGPGHGGPNYGHRPYYGRPYGGHYYRPYYGGYYRPYYGGYYWPYYSSWYLGFGYPYFWGGWGPGYYPYWGGGYAAYPPDAGAVRLQVKPRETEVFVDGYLAGQVDDFDGTFERLRLEPGEHEITLYLDGHRTVRERLNLARGGDYRIKHVMQPLAPGEASEPRPQPTVPVPAAQPPTGTVRYEPPPPSNETGVTAVTGFGAVSIRVQPADAAVFLDGERWDTPSGSERLVVQLAPGPHEVEIRRDGYVPYSTIVEIRVREATVLNVSLPRN